MNRLATNPTNEKLPVFERVIEFLNGVGYLGIAALLFLENLFPPMPSDYFDIEVEKGTFRADAKATMEMRQRAVCRQPGPRRPGNPCRGGARANVLNTGIAAAARRAR